MNTQNALIRYGFGNEIKRTTGRCQICKELKPARVLKLQRCGKEQVVMMVDCEKDGERESLLSSDSRFYYSRPKGDTKGGCGCGPNKCLPVGGGREGTLGENATNEAKRGDLEKLSTCLALIEIVDSCNLACPTCFADSPLGSNAKVKYHSLQNITSRIEGVLNRKGQIEIIQFSGGEPTIHPEFFELCEWVRREPRIEYLVVNTNGVRLATDEEFVTKFGELVKKHGNIQLYLQFDGPQYDGQKELRGADLRGIRKKAIKNCGKIGLPITLAMTVGRENLPHIWDTVEFARKFDHVRGVSFQPMFLSGRNPEVKSLWPLPSAINVADIILELVDKSDGVLSGNDFTPLPCGDPNCLTIGWLMRLGGKYHSPSKFGIDIPALQAQIPNRVNYTAEDLQKCGCDDTALGDLMKKMEVRESNAFRISIKPFMDERTWDEDRIAQCCTHVIRPDGQLDSFCRYFFNGGAKAHALQPVAVS